MAVPIKLYVDLMSQPSRSVVLFCRCNDIEHELVVVNIYKREHLKAPYAAINPLKKLPCMDDCGFLLPESHAILRYLATTRHTPDHWYPADPKQRARVDSVLDWHHANTRRGSMGIAFALVVGPNLGFPVDMQAAKDSASLLTQALKNMNNAWLKDNEPFLAGQQEMSIADISVACEIMQLKMLRASGDENGFSWEQLIGPYARVQRWLEAVQAATSPHFDDVHRKLLDLAARMAAKRNQSRL
eukprot:jgi/Chlat1/6499/Chrsp45S05990